MEAPAQSHDGMIKTVLVVDDEFNITELLEFVFEDAGFRVVRATNGCHGLHRLSEEPRPDLVLLDLVMPVLDGPSMLHTMRGGPFRDIPVVIMSSLDERTVTDSCGNTYQAFLRKPFSMCEAVQTVQRFLSS